MNERKDLAQRFRSLQVEDFLLWLLVFVFAIMVINVLIGMKPTWTLDEFVSDLVPPFLILFCAIAIREATQRTRRSLHILDRLRIARSVVDQSPIPLMTDHLRSLGALISTIPAHEPEWLLLVHAPGVLVQGASYKFRFLRAASVNWGGERMAALENIVQERLSGMLEAYNETEQGRVPGGYLWAAHFMNVAAVYAVSYPNVATMDLDPVNESAVSVILNDAVRRFHYLAQSVGERQEALTRDDYGLIVAGVTHELSGELQYLISELRNQENHKAFSPGQIRKVLWRSFHWIEVLRDAPYKKTGLFSVDRHPLDIRVLLTNVLEQVQGAWPDREFSVRFQSNGRTGPRVLADDHLRTILRNVLFNAASFSPEGGQVDVHVAENNRAVTVRVTDEGDGIPPEIRDNLFEPLVTVGNERRARGRGVGLWLARGLARAYGGDLRLACQPDEQTCFELTLNVPEEGE